MGLMTVCEAIGAFNTTWVRGKLSDLKVIYLFTWVIAASLFFIPYHGQALTVAAFCLFSLSLGFTFPIQRQLLNDAITDPNYRASLLSVESILDRAASALLISFAGVYVGGGRVGDFLQISTAIALGFVTLVFVVIQSQSKKI
jgi:hypothetical protein